MLHCDINLAKGVVWPRTQRLTAYRLLMLYLFIMALLIISRGVGSVRQVTSGIRDFSQGREMDLEFVRNHPDQTSIENYAEKLKQQLENDTARIKSIQDALPPTMDTPLPALVLMVNQGEKTSLHTLSFVQPTDNEPARLIFELVTPANSSQNGDASREFQDAWKSSPNLFRHFPDIKQLQLRRTRLNGRDMLITQYQATGRD